MLTKNVHVHVVSRKGKELLGAIDEHQLAGWFFLGNTCCKHVDWPLRSLQVIGPSATQVVGGAFGSSGGRP